MKKYMATIERIQFAETCTLGVDMSVKSVDSTERDGMSFLVRDMLSGRYSTPELVEFFHAYPPEKLSSEALAGCLDGVLAAAAYTIDASRFDKPVVVPAGTGGDGKGTVNITTMAGFVMAASDRCVVPLYGNRKASGKFGKMDLLEALNIPIDGDSGDVRYALETMSIAPVFARNSYPGARYVAEARVQYGKPTLFNIVMPQAAPVTIDAALLIGSSREDQLENMGRIARTRGVKRAIFVHNIDHHLDELANGRNKIVIVDSETVNSLEVVIGEGENIEMLQAESPSEFTRIFQETLDPSQQSPQLDAIRRVVALNAACGLFLASGSAIDFTESFPHFYDEALEIIRSGKAKVKLDEMRGVRI